MPIQLQNPVKQPAIEYKYLHLESFGLRQDAKEGSKVVVSPWVFVPYGVDENGKKHFDLDNKIILRDNDLYLTIGKIKDPAIRGLVLQSMGAFLTGLSTIASIKHNIPSNFVP